MKPELLLDTSQWTKAARELHETSSRTCVDFINGQALKVAIEAGRRTDKADAARIEHELGATAREVSFRQLSRGKNKGKWRTKRGGYSVREDSLASRILGWRMKNKGHFGKVPGNTDAERVQNLIKLRVKSRSFIASGWIGARNALFKLVRQKDPKTRTISDAKQYGQPKGSAKAARFTLRSVMEAIIQNTALLKPSSEPTKVRDPKEGTARKGLQAALNESARDMTAELARRLQPDFNKVSAK